MKHETFYIKIDGGISPFVCLCDDGRYVTHFSLDCVTSGRAVEGVYASVSRLVLGPGVEAVNAYVMSLAWDELV